MIPQQKKGPGEKLRHFRKQKGYKQDQVAKMLNVHPQTYRRWESEDSKIPVVDFERALAIYEVDLVPVYRFEENKYG